MSDLNFLGIGRKSRLHRDDPGVELVAPNRALSRILSFTGFTIDDVIDNPIARNAVRGYFKLDKEIKRRSEIIDLEKQWSVRPPRNAPDK